MSNYDYSYDIVDEPRRHKHRHHHRDRDDAPYREVRETYVSAPLAPEPPYPSQLVRRREDSDLSVEEVQRQFPPPGGAYVQSRSMVRDDRYGPPAVRSRSAERGSQYGTYLGDPRDERSSRRKSVVREEVIERHRSLSRNQKILAGVAGAALAVGGKELWDRREAEKGGSPRERNLLGTAAVGAAGAFAGYEATELYSKQIAKNDGKKKKVYTAVQDRHGNVAESYESDSGSDRPKKSSRRKSIIEGALGLAGIGAAAKAAGGGRDRSKGRDKRGSSSDSYTSRRSRGGKSSKGGDGDGLAKIQQAAKAALLAGAAEAFRVRNEPGGWGGAKGKRILTAAIGAGAIDSAADRDPDRHSKRHVLEAVVGGLAGNRIVNGSRNKLDDDGRSIRGGRSRSRSRAPSSGGGGAGLAALATAGLGALAAKKFTDRSRSRSRADGDRRRRSVSSEDDDRGDRRHKRSKSVSDYARKGLAALGIGEAVEANRDKDDRHSTREVEETRVVHKSRRRRDSSADSYEEPRRSSGHRSRGVYDDDRHADSRSSVGGGDRRRRKDGDPGDRDRRVAEGKKGESDSDSLGSSSGDERRVKKMKGKQLLTTGLAAVATIHAAHNVYQSVEKRNARHKAVQEGEMTPEEAKKLKTKARLQDAASIGIAALGIKGAYSEWKEMNELRHEYKELEEKKEERHLKRMERQKGIKEKAGDDVGGGRSRHRSDPRHASTPDLAYDGRSPVGPTYVDSNPYAPGLPAPPVGYTYADRR